MAKGPPSQGGWHFVLAGLVAAIAVPALAVELRFPLIAALPIAAILFFGLSVLFAPRKITDGIDRARIDTGQARVVEAVLADCAPALSRLREARSEIDGREAREQVDRLIERCESVIARLKQEPERLGSVQRLLTYYLPRAAEIAQTYARLDDRPQAAAERLAQLRGVLLKLNEAFDHYENQMVDEELAGLDAEIRHLEASLEEDVRWKDRNGGS